MPSLSHFVLLLSLTITFLLHPPTPALCHSTDQPDATHPSLSPSHQTYILLLNRTVTNLGQADSVYKLKLDVPKSLIVSVYPETLVFSKAGQKISYTITVSSHGNEQEKFMEGSLSWVSGHYVVRSPIIAVVGLL